MRARGGIPGARPGLRVASVSLVLALALAGCTPPQRYLELRLPEGLGILMETPSLPSLPRGWSYFPASTDSRPRGSGDCVLVLEWRRLGDLPRGTVPAEALRRRWLAPALPMADLRFDLSLTEARTQGLRELSAIEPPLRVPAVEGRLPGDGDWPFAEVLVGWIEKGGRSPPRALLSWWRKTQAFLEHSEVEIPGSVPAGGETPWRLGAVGDMQFGPDEAPLVLGGRPGLEKVFGRILPVMEAQDILVGNLEGAITLSTEANPRKRFQFRMPPGTSSALGAAGFDLVLLGNNHVLDFGGVGFADSLADAAAGGLPTVGAGRDEAEALATKALATKKSGAAFIGFASFPAERYGFTTAEAAAGPGKPGVNADEAATIEAIEAEAVKGNLVVVLAHGGNEYLFDPSPEIRRRYGAFIDAGASLVLGSHPHLLQGVEARGRGYIAYSLGNFLFTGEREPELALASALLSFLVYRGQVRGFVPRAIVAGYTGSDLDDTRGGATIEAFAKRCAKLALPD